MLWSLHLCFKCQWEDLGPNFLPTLRPRHYIQGTLLWHGPCFCHGRQAGRHNTQRRTDTFFHLHMRKVDCAILFGKRPWNSFCPHHTILKSTRFLDSFQNESTDTRSRGPIRDRELYVLVFECLGGSLTTSALPFFSMPFATVAWWYCCRLAPVHATRVVY